MSIQARYVTTCPACDELIHVGDQITADPLDGAAVTYVHLECPVAVEHTNPVCTECFIEKPCECDDLAVTA